MMIHDPVVLWISLLRPLHLHLAPSVCLILAKSYLLWDGCGLYWAATVVQDGQGYVVISVLHSFKLF